MALESATYISGLVTTNPTGSDSISQGDDHIRLIKTVLKNSLPNVTTATTPLVSLTHAIQSTTSTFRSDTYIDTGWSITHDKVSTTSTLYVHVDGMNDVFSAWDGGSDHQFTDIRLSNTAGVLIVGTTDNIRVGDIKDLVPTGLSSCEWGFGMSHTWKVTAANCPDGTSGNNTFDIWSKQPTAAGGGTTFVNGTMVVWEIEE
jgi:hypothetical protein